MTTDLVGKYFVVTGGTAGVGEATAALLAERGAAGVAICGRNAERGEAVRSALAARGCRSVFIKADLAKIDDCFDVVDAAIEEFGRLELADQLLRLDRAGHAGEHIARTLGLPVRGQCPCPVFPELSALFRICGA